MGVCVQNAVMHAPKRESVEGKPKHLPDTHLVKASGAQNPGYCGVFFEN